MDGQGFRHCHLTLATYPSCQPGDELNRPLPTGLVFSSFMTCMSQGARNARSAHIAFRRSDFAIFCQCFRRPNLSLTFGGYQTDIRKIRISYWNGQHMSFGFFMTGFSGWVVCFSRRICCWAFAVPNSLQWVFFLSEQLGFNHFQSTFGRMWTLVLSCVCFFERHDTWFVLVIGLSFRLAE